MQNTNQQKLQKAIQQLGQRWVLHKANQTQRRVPFNITATELRSRLGYGDQ